MKIKLISRGAMAIVSVDGRRSEVDPSFEQGNEKVIDVKDRFTICGNPIDPWRIVVDVVLLGETT